MQAEILFTGTELLLGEVHNTHAQYLGRELAELGIEVTRHTAVGDNRETLGTAMQDALSRTDLLLVTGGLGPTEDDLTAETAAALLGLDMVVDPGTMRKLEELFARRRVPMPSSMKKQALVPRGAAILPNPAGTAPGLVLQSGPKTIIMLPGPPRELKAVFDKHVRQLLRQLAPGGVVMHTTVLKLAGLSESQVQDRLQELHAPGNPVISYVALPGEVHVRVTARTGNEGESRRLAGEMAARVESILGDHLFGRDEELLEETVGMLLAARGLTVSAAESCTGGQVMKRLTDVAGSSRYFVGGVVSYSNELKINLLGVPAEVLERHGAVSEQTAGEMAGGVRRVTGSAIGIGITGIAGPEGGSPEKPVGLVYIALDDGEKTFCHRHIFPGPRTGVRAGAVNCALNMLRRYLMGRLD